MEGKPRNHTTQSHGLGMAFEDWASAIANTLRPIRTLEFLGVWSMGLGNPDGFTPRCPPTRRALARPVSRESVSPESQETEERNPITGFMLTTPMGGLRHCVGDSE
jgi:hypothetical protein